MKNIVSIMFLFFLVACAVAQPPETYTTKKKKAIKAYKAAQTCYNNYDVKTGRPDFAGAETNLKKALSIDPNFMEAHILISQVYMDWGKNQLAIESLRKSISVNPSFFPNSWYFLARLELQEGMYEAAKADITKFMERPRIPEDMMAVSKKIIDNCDFAIQAKKNPVPFEPKNLGPGVNTSNPEYFPTITADDQTLLFTRQVKDEKSPMGVQEDFFVSKKTNNEWAKGVSISSKINTIYNEGAPTFSPDGQMLIFAACEFMDIGYGDYRDGFGSCDLFITRRIGEQWSTPINMGEPVNSGIWESQPSFSADGKTVYYIRARMGSDRRMSGDIWYTQLDKYGNWGKPQRLNDVINTNGNEESVLIHPDGQTLYFSSNGHTGMGGLDIYMSRKDKNGNWGTPVNLGYPINTHHDENSLLVSADGKLAFFASDRPGGFGDLDLYSFELPEKFQPQLTTYMKGKVFDAKTNDKLEAKFELIDLSTGELIVESYSNPGNGEFLVSIATNRNYALNVTKNGYLYYSKNFSLTEQKGKTEPFLMDVPLIPVTDTSGIVLENIFFDLDQFTLRPESKVELNKFYEFLVKNPKLKVEIQGHTDSRGNKKANQLLSENRAKAVADYLIGKGIDKSRLSSRGFGDTKPKIANPQTEEDHQKNRRTEYVMVK
ncbi:MAG: OmpA family protein [Bacteroidota bacterium]